MHITFIRPNMFQQRSSDAMQPLCFAILRSQTPADVETSLYDERLEPIDFSAPTDLVALTVETYTARRAYEIAAAYRQRNIPVVMGGYHPTFLPDEALQYADAVVLGDAEGIWPTVVEDAQRGRLRRIYRQEQFPSLAGAPPDRSIFRGKHYSPVTLVQYGRGCRYNCNFCSIRAFYGNNLRQRPVSHVVEEIRRIGRKLVFLVDDNLFVDVPKAKELFEALIPLKILWFCQVSIDITRDPELLRLMRRSGCISALVGFESLNRDNLRQMRKDWNVKYADYTAAIKALQDEAIMIYGTFVFGYDHDTRDSFDEAAQFAIDNKFYLANFNPLTPTPGAELYEQLSRENRLIYDRWWLDPEYRYGHATFHPRGMTAEELTAGCFRARARFNTVGSILRRSLAPRTSMRSPYRLGVYLLANWISRREIHAKQGCYLGSRQPLTPLPSEPLPSEPLPSEPLPSESLPSESRAETMGSAALPPASLGALV